MSEVGYETIVILVCYSDQNYHLNNLLKKTEKTKSVSSVGLSERQIVLYLKFCNRLYFHNFAANSTWESKISATLYMPANWKTNKELSDLCGNLQWSLHSQAQGGS